jgi:hydrogenase nickel incorporation protein HypB
LNKIDLLPHVEFDTERFKAYARDINPDLIFFETSATTGAGMEPWAKWIRSNVQK